MNKKQTKGWINHISKQIIWIQRLINMMSYYIQTYWICFCLNIHLVHLLVTCISYVPTVLWLYAHLYLYHPTKMKHDQAYRIHTDRVTSLCTEQTGHSCNGSEGDSLQTKCSARTTVDLVLETPFFSRHYGSLQYVNECYASIH